MSSDPRPDPTNSGADSSASEASTPQEADGQSRVREVAAAAQEELVALDVPPWLRTIGTGAWLAFGVVVVTTVVVLFLALVAEVAIPLAIAAVLAAILVPITDRLERWSIPRWPRKRSNATRSFRMGAPFSVGIGRAGLRCTIG